MGTYDTKRRGGRPRTGTLESGGRWPTGAPRFRFRLRLADGTKSERFDVPEGHDIDSARSWVAGLQAEEDVRHGFMTKKQEAVREKAALSGTACEGESVDAWYARFIPTLDCGDRHRRISVGAWKKWISPAIGPKPMRSLTRDDIEDIRDKIDRALDAKEIRHSTARNIWGALTGALKAACSSRDRSLRVHATPLHFGILPPKKGTSRERPWLYPREWSRLMACDAVPAAHRQVYAIAVYTGLRPGELRALTFGDVDLEARTISVSKAFDKETGKTKAPKTARGQRVIPLHPSLAPLLDAMKGESTSLVVPTLLAGNEHRFAQGFRSHLLAAGVDRPRLSADNETQEPVDFRSLRDSYATWLALAGTSDKVIQRRMGHASAATTDRYIKAAESLDVAAIGEPFPALPAALCTRVWPNVRPKAAALRGLPRRFVAPTAGLETAPAPIVSPHSPCINEMGDAAAANEPTSEPHSLGFGPTTGPVVGTEAALARALDLAAAAGRFDVVVALADELKARRLAAAGNVVTLDAARKKRSP